MLFLHVILRLSCAFCSSSCWSIPFVAELFGDHAGVGTNPLTFEFLFGLSQVDPGHVDRAIRLRSAAISGMTFTLAITCPDAPVAGLAGTLPRRSPISAA